MIPAFYDRDPSGLPGPWVARMRASMTGLTLQYSAGRAVREYTETHYLPAALAFRDRAADRGARGKQIDAWRQTLEKGWEGLSFGDVRAITEAGNHRFEVEVFFGELDPDMVQVELYAEGDAPVRKAMDRIRPLPESTGGFLYRAGIRAVRPADDYTVRAIAQHSDVRLPLEAPQILWQR